MRVPTTTLRPLESVRAFSNGGGFTSYRRETVAQREYNRVETESTLMTAADPSPAGQMVIVYDGDCAFCQRSIAEIRRRDRDGLFLYIPRQTPGIESQYPQATEGDFDTGLRFIDPAGDLYIGADAIHQIVSRLPVWRRFAWAYRFPPLRILAKWGYGWVAANRMKLSHYCSQDAACTVDDRGDPSLPRTEKE